MLLAQPAARLTFERLKPSFDFARRELTATAMDCPDKIGPKVRDETPQGTEHTRRRWNNDAIDPHFTREQERMGRSRAAVCEDGKIAYVHTPPRHERNELRIHIRRRHIEHVPRDLFRRAREPRRDRRKCREGTRGVQYLMAAKKVCGIDDAEHDVRVRNRWLGPAALIARRSGI